MKKGTILSISMAVVMSLLLACSSKQTADQYLKDDTQRKDILVTIAHHQTYMTEMMQQMMNSDSCKQMMGQSMMGDPAMMNMMMDHMMSMCNNDSSMCKNMMGKMMEMCDADQSKCKMMMGTMQSHPNVMKSMKRMGDMEMMPKKTNKR
jgi:hypothetical protein